MKRYSLLVCLTASLAVAGASAQPTMDGSIVGDETFYGGALSTQPTQTQFGDNSSADLVATADGGSELNQVFGRIDGDTLYVMITGNLETNFNKLSVFVDSVAGGVNQLDGDNLPASVDGFCCGQSDPNVPVTDGALQRMDGLGFDTGFDADYFFTFSNGSEGVRPDGPDRRNFWAINATYAELGAGASGDFQALGYQTAPQGLPNVLRNPMDYNGDGTVDVADYTVWRDSDGQTGAGLPADGNGSGTVDVDDYDNWVTNFNSDATLSGDQFVPTADFPVAQQQVDAGVTLPGLSQGELIDRTYALGAGGCTDDSGAGCLAPELEFALDVAPGDADNAANHRNYSNTIGLELGFDNSNTAGVTGGTDPAPGEAETATTGLEFSVPLAALGNPTGDIRLMAFVNGNGHDFISNQISGDGLTADPMIGLTSENLGTLLFGSPPLGSFVDVPGDQFVTIAAPGGAAVPEPTTAVLVALGLAGVGVRRR
ncbi:MAG: PEP-CTERM sorting domain-containing protein [Planctomycetota bacterium]